MSITLTRFAVNGLHGKFDIDIPIYDNRLILVGVNGLGKTTVVNLMYFLLTVQWERLLESEFASLTVVINDRYIEISRQDIQHKVKLVERYEKVVNRYATRAPMPTRLLKRLLSHPEYQELARMSPGPAQQASARRIGQDVEIPTTYVLRVLADFSRSSSEDLFESVKDTPAMINLLHVLKEAGNHQVIYLPTYRRIEQDLKAVFPNLDEEELRKLTSSGLGGSLQRTTGHIELIQFGMEDVEEKIGSELAAIRERTRTQLSNLTASYLKDIIRNRADDVKTELFKQIEDDVVTEVLNRVEENTLSLDDKHEVRSAISRIRAGSAVVEVRDKYLAYFFSRLLDIYVALSDSERSIRTLVETCNKYFDRKALIYNDTAYTANVVDADESPLSWKVLSSGEKQVASLFTHLFLSKGAEQAVIIDEPELSLSVQWQKTLLPDIVDSGNCRLLIAVTHSPFVYANSLEKYAVDLSRYIHRHVAG